MAAWFLVAPNEVIRVAVVSASPSTQRRMLSALDADRLLVRCFYSLKAALRGMSGTGRCVLVVDVGWGSACQWEDLIATTKALPSDTDVVAVGSATCPSVAVQSNQHGIFLCDDRMPGANLLCNVMRAWANGLLRDSSTSRTGSAHERSVVICCARQWRLSPRQADILPLVVQGMSNKDIACYLSTAESTIEAHISRIFRAAGVSCRVELIRAVLSSSAMGWLEGAPQTPTAVEPATATRSGR